MKAKSTLLALLILAGCSDDVDLGGGDGPLPLAPGASDATGTDNGSPEEELTGDITADRHLTKDKSYLMKGRVNVKPGVTLTIDPGVVIKGDNTTKAILLIEAGAKIQAAGTADEPIVFTSQAREGERKAGDWGGIIVLGKAPINVRDTSGNPIQASVEGILEKGKTGGTLYGGNDPNDDSGTLRYVRIEYAGVVISTDNEVNGLTLAGVGRGTKIDHVQVRQALDDCFEFFGGTVDAKYLVCQGNQDDGFDFDLGYTGRLQFLVLQQDPNHEGDDNGFESDNDDKATGNTPLTNPTVYNATLIGKNKSVGGSQFGMLLRKNTRGTYRNLVVTGFQAALDVRDAIGDLSIANTAFFGSVGASPYIVTDNIAFVEDKSTIPSDLDEKGRAAYKARPDYIDDTTDEVAWFKAGEGNVATNLGLVRPFDSSAPVFSAVASLTDGAATPPNDGFFDEAAAYRGAFKDANDTWASTGKWVVWSAK
jgi:hypothetical protein